MWRSAVVEGGYVEEAGGGCAGGDEAEEHPEDGKEVQFGHPSGEQSTAVDLVGIFSFEACCEVDALTS